MLKTSIRAYPRYGLKLGEIGPFCCSLIDYKIHFLLQSTRDNYHHKKIQLIKAPSFKLTIYAHPSSP